MVLMRLVIVSVTSLGIAACQGALHKYDGVLGYSAATATDGRVLITYTEEARVDWADLEESAADACAHEMKRERESVNLSNLEKQELTQNVDMTFLVPLVPGSVVSMKDSGGVVVQPVMTVPSSHMSQTVERELKLKRLTAECVSKGAD